MHKTTILVCGKEYRLNTNLAPDYLNKLTDILNGKLREVFNEDKNLSLFDGAVLVALEILDESLKGTENADNIREQIKIYSDEVDKLKGETIALNAEIASLKEENDRLTNEISLQDLKKKASLGD